MHRAGRVSLVFACWLLLCWAAAAQAATQFRLAALDLRNGAGLSEDESGYLSDQVRAAAASALSSKWLVMTKESMVELLPPGRTLLDCVKSAECEVDLGRKLGARDAR